LIIHFHCDCGQKLKASADSVGKHFDCPVCGASVVVPEQDESVSARKKPVAAAVTASEASPMDEAKPAPPVRRSAGTNEAKAKVDLAKADDGKANGAKANGAKAVSNGSRRPAKKRTDDDLAMEALGFGADDSASDTNELAETDTKVINGSDTKELDRPKEQDRPVREGYLPKSELRLRSESEILAEQERSHDAHRVYGSDADVDEASTADTARDLYKLVRKMKKSETAVEAERQKKRQRKVDDGEAFDLGGFIVEMSRTVVPGVVGVLVVCAIAYWVSSSVMSAGRGLPELGRVSGVVTLDGAPLAGATVTFMPAIEDEEAAARIASSVGMTNEQGEYSLMYVKDVAGAAVGPHHVMISAPQPNGAEALPRKYNTASELEFEVKPGSNDAPFKLTSK
jgi:hypothetical protein